MLKSRISQSGAMHNRQSHVAATLTRRHPPALAAGELLDEVKLCQAARSPVDSWLHHVLSLQIRLQKHLQGPRAKYCVVYCFEMP